MNQAIQLIAEERERQIAAEGYTPAHDDGHVCGDLAAAAACYALPPQIRSVSLLGRIWPWDADEFKPTPDGTRVRELVKAGALIVAEIERLQRHNEGRAMRTGPLIIVIRGGAGVGKTLLAKWIQSAQPEKAVTVFEHGEYASARKALAKVKAKRGPHIVVFVGDWPESLNSDMEISVRRGRLA